MIVVSNSVINHICKRTHTHSHTYACDDEEEFNDRDPEHDDDFDDGYIHINDRAEQVC